MVSPLFANIILNHLDGFLDQQPLKLVTPVIEEDLGLTLSPEKTRITTFGRGVNFLGFYVSTFTIRMSDKAVDPFKSKIKEHTCRSHNLEASVVVKLNRVIRGMVRYFSKSFTTTLGQFNVLDQFIRRQIHSMKYKRIWSTDNRRFKDRHIWRGGISCRETYTHAC